MPSARTASGIGTGVSQPAILESGEEAVSDFVSDWDWEAYKRDCRGSTA